MIEDVRADEVEEICFEGALELDFIRLWDCGEECFDRGDFDDLLCGDCYLLSDIDFEWICGLVL